MYTNEIMTGA